MTPNPFPAMAETETQYAHVDGVTVWEGAVEEIEGKGEKVMKEKTGATIFRNEGGWGVIWRGQVPVGM
jgi:hypothetical protein